MKPIICHRGASAYAPENTMAAFKAAEEMGCETVEFDVMLSADGEAFVFHDELLNRSTNAKGSFAEQSSEQLQALDAGTWFSKRFEHEKIPTFKQVLDWLKTTSIQANIEIKPTPGRTEETTMAVLSALNRDWPHDRPLPLISSFDVAALRLCHSIAPEMPIGLLLDKWDDAWQKLAKELQCVSIHINQKELTKKRAMEIKQQGYKLFVYTVNQKRLLDKLSNWGVDAVFSDYPDLVS